MVFAHARASRDAHVVTQSSERPFSRAYPRAAARSAGDDSALGEQRSRPTGTDRIALIRLTLVWLAISAVFVCLIVAARALL